jgi:addiction module RelB/DinJ family antitoxin
MSDLVIVKARVKKPLKDKSAEVLDELGLDISTAIRMLLSYIARTGKLPIMDQPYIINIPEGNAQDVKDLMKKLLKNPTILAQLEQTKETNDEECTTQVVNDLCDPDNTNDDNWVSNDSV